MKLKLVHNIIYILIGILLPLLTLGQNLIPNGGFEEFKNHDVKYWKQPSEPFYHFEKIEGNSRSGVGYNGLCLWKWQLSEFMAIELLEPLEKGAFYQFTMYARRGPNITINDGDSLTHLGILLSPKQRDVSKKMIVADSANILLRLDTLPSWSEMKGLYLAKGGEQYLTLGYFPFINGRSNNCVQHLDVESKLARYDSLNTAMKDSINSAIQFIKEEFKLDKSWDEINTIKDRRQRKKDLEEFKNNTYLLSLNMQLAMQQIKRYFSSLSQPYAIINTGNNCNCRARYYFDDLELIKVNDNQLNAERMTLDNIYFDTDEAILKVASNESLDKFALLLKERKNILVRVEGYTDNVGDKNHNTVLSDSRAQAVTEYLISKGLDKNCLSYKGYGSNRPVASNTTAAGRSKNRRVEISIVQLAK